jgi:hypothetical protein
LAVGVVAVGIDVVVWVGDLDDAVLAVAHEGCREPSN